MDRSTTTRFAYVVAGVLMAGSTVLGLAALFTLPVFGFGAPDPPATAQAGATTATSAATSTVAPLEEGPVVVVEQIRYVDDFVTRRSPSAPGPSVDATPPPATTPAPTTAEPATTVASSAPPPAPSPTTTRAPAATSTIPPPPPGCDEPEWDKDQQRWHCKGD